MRIAVAQIGSGENKEMNRYMIERLAWSASEAGADMLFLPEYAMFCAGNDRAARNMEAAEPFDGPFALQPAEFPQQDRGQSFFVAGRHASGSWVKVQRTEAACGS